MDHIPEDIKRQAEELQEFIENDLLDIVEVEGLNHFEESFENEGFTDTSLVKWEKRKTTNRGGRDLTVYRTNRRGKAGRLNSFGQKNKGRQTLTGHGSGGNKLRNSGRANKIKGAIQFIWDKEYAERHNEGTDGMTKRQFVGESKVVNNKIDEQVEQNLNKIFD